MLTPRAFVLELTATVPEVQPLLREHLEDHDDLLIHLLLSDLLRFAALAHGRGDESLAGACLLEVERALLHGDDYLQNAVCVSFVEHVGAFAEETPAFVSSWPAALLQEKARQGSLGPQSHGARTYPSAQLDE